MTHIKDAARVMLLNQGHEAQRIISDLLREYPADTFLNELDMPLAMAVSQLGVSHADAALGSLDRTRPFEFGSEAIFLPTYIRGLAQLHLMHPEAAAGEFSAALAHRGHAPLNPILIASQLGLAVPARYSETWARAEPLTRPFSQSGKMPTRTSRSSSKQNPSTQNCNSFNGRKR